MKKVGLVARNRWVILVLGFLVGVLVILSVRYVAYSPEQVHYHANMAVYINGQREEFKDAKYYQEVAVCSSTDDIKLPKQRAHMHDNVNSVVHVHDHAVTWGQFFENLGWYVGPDFIQTDVGTLYKAEGASKLNIIINGDDYTDIQAVTNMIIADESRLLISFGERTEKQLADEYRMVSSSAHKYNHIQDPASCSGSHKITPKDRMQHLL